MKLRVLCLFLVISSNSWATGTPVFDLSNFKNTLRNYTQSIKILSTNLKQLEQLKNQAEDLKRQTDFLKKQSKLQKDKWNLNSMKLDSSIFSKLRRNYDDTNRLLFQSKAVNRNLSQLDDYFKKFEGDGANLADLPSDEQSKQLDQQYTKAIESNKRAISSLKVLESYEQDSKNTKAVLASSQSAKGTMQALQANNELIGIAIKNNQEMKAMMAADLEQRTLAMAEDNQSKRIANAVNKQFWQKPERYNRREVRLPKLAEPRNNG